MQDNFVLDNCAVIGTNGKIYGGGFPTEAATIWDYDYVNSGQYDSYIQFTQHVQSLITKKTFKTLCMDLGTNLGDYDNMAIGGFLKKIYQILQERDQMPKVRHRHKFLWLGVDNTSKADGRCLIDFIDDNKKNEVFEKKWGEIGVDDKERKEYLIKHAKPEKQKKLAKLLKYKGNWKDLFKNENTATSPSNTQQQQPVLNNIAGVPTTTPTQAEQYDPALINWYAHARAHWNKSHCVTKAINKFFAKLFWKEQDYKNVFEHATNIAQNNLVNSSNANNININN